jgi:hypothetical protein
MSKYVETYQDQKWLEIVKLTTSIRTLQYEQEQIKNTLYVESKYPVRSEKQLRELKRKKNILQAKIDYLARKNLKV